MSTEAFLLVLTIFWTVGAIVGMTFSARSIRRRQWSLRSVQAELHPDPLLLHLARWNLRLEVNRLLSQIAFFIIGVVTLLPGRPDWQRVVGGIVILLGVALVYANSYLTERMEEGAVDIQRERDRG